MLHAPTLVNYNKYLLIIVFGSACHNNMVSYRERFEPPDLLARIQVQVKFQVISLNFKSSRESSKWTRVSPFDSRLKLSSPLHLVTYFIMQIPGNYLQLSISYLTNMHFKSTLVRVHDADGLRMMTCNGARAYARAIARSHTRIVLGDSPLSCTSYRPSRFISACMQM